jgi:MFS family permease
MPYNRPRMNPSGAPTASSRPAAGAGDTSWRIVALASLGGTLEFYDFVVFGIFAKDIADAVFPSASPLASLMASFAAFAAGYVARPVGGIVLSHYGDRHGRRRVFLWSLFVMSGATLGMGLVPAYAQWGVAASGLMVALRLLQGFCLGGELPGALTYVVETAPRIAPLVCGAVFACVTMGVAAATAVSVAVRTILDPASVPVYGWRIAFVVGGLGGALSFVLRRSLEESPEFARMRSLAVRQPFRELLRTHAVQVLVGSATLAGTACFNGLFFSHLPAYLSAVLRYDPRLAVFSQTAGVVAAAVGILITGWMGDRVPPRYLLRAGVAALLLGAYPFYRALDARSVDLTGALVQRIVRRPADGLVSHAHPIHRRGARLQRRVHAVQRHGAARCHDAHPRNRRRRVAGVPDDGLRAAGAAREPLDREVWRERPPVIMERRRDRWRSVPSPRSRVSRYGVGHTERIEGVDQPSPAS